MDRKKFKQFFYFQHNLAINVQPNVEPLETIDAETYFIEISFVKFLRLIVNTYFCEVLKFRMADKYKNIHMMCTNLYF